MPGRLKYKKIFILLLLLSTFLLTIPSVKAGTQRRRLVPTARNAENVIWESKLYSQIGFLSDSICTGRASGTRGNVEAGFWIARRFAQIGLTPFGGSYSQSFISENGTVCHNLTAILPGSDMTDTRYIIIGAHYDHLGTLAGNVYPGADANASGVVAMISLAEMLRSMNRLGKIYSKSVIFVAFDAKQLNMAGSKALFKMLECGLLKDPITGRAIQKKDISMMVNIDQIGGTSATLKDGRPDYMIMLGGPLGFSDGGLMNADQNDRINLELAFDYYGSKDFTNLFYRKVCDQKVFLDHKIPSVLFTSGITMFNNKPFDTVDTLDMSIMARRIRLIYYWLIQRI